MRLLRLLYHKEATNTKPVCLRKLQFGFQQSDSIFGFVVQPSDFFFFIVFPVCLFTRNSRIFFFPYRLLFLNVLVSLDTAMCKYLDWSVFVWFYSWLEFSHPLPSNFGSQQINNSIIYILLHFDIRERSHQFISLNSLKVKYFSGFNRVCDFLNKLWALPSKRTRRLSSLSFNFHLNCKSLLSINFIVSPESSVKAWNQKMCAVWGENWNLIRSRHAIWILTKFSNLIEKNFWLTICREKKRLVNPEGYEWP